MGLTEHSHQNAPRAGRPLWRGAWEHVYLLEQLLFCGTCGSLMSPRTSLLRRFHYRCPGNCDGMNDCRGLTISAERIEVVITERVRRLARHDAACHRAIQLAMTVGKNERIARIREVDNGIASIVTVVRKGNASYARALELQQLQTQRASLSDEIARIEAQEVQIKHEMEQAAHTDAAEDCFPLFDTVFNAMTGHEKRKLILSFVVSVRYTHEQIRIETFGD